FIRVKRAGFKPSLNLLYALEGAILGCHWQEIPEDRRQALVLAANEEAAKLPPPRGKRMPAAGPVTTVRHDLDEGTVPEPDLGFDDPASDRDGAAGPAHHRGLAGALTALRRPPEGRPPPPDPAHPPPQGPRPA